MYPMFLQAAAPNPDTIDQIQSIVNAMASDNFPKAFGFLCLTIVIILITFFIIFKAIEHVFSKSDYIKLGLFTFKNKKNQNNVETNKVNHEVDMNMFIRILDIIMTSELEKMATDVITATKDIRKIEDTYDEQTYNIFNKTLNTVRGEYHDRLVMMAMNVTGFDLLKIKNTREYFFIMDLLRNFELEWMKTSKEITRRNGFVEFLNDKTRSRDYIEELQECIYQCIDSRKLDMTDLKKENVEEAIDVVNKDIYVILEKMFTNLANLKKSMLLKREAKLKYIDETIKTSAMDIIMTVKTKIIDNVFANRTNNLEPVKENNNQTEEVDSIE